jgi:hypothetical protein
MTWAGREVTVGSCTVGEQGEVTIAFEDPATLILEVPDGPEAESVAVLYRRQETTGWSFGGNYEETEITGTRSGSELRFSPQTPGTYAIVRSDLAGNRFALETTADHVTLRAGDVTRRPWTPNGKRIFSVRLDLPPDRATSSLAVGFAPASRVPVNLLSATWTTFDAEGTATWTSGEEGHGYLMVVGTSGNEDSARASGPALLAVAEVSAGDARVDMRVASPARLRVAGEPSQIIVLIHPLLSSVAGYYPRLSADGRSPPLMPGRWRIEWHEPGGGLVRSTEVDLAPGDDRYVGQQSR